MQRRTLMAARGLRKLGRLALWFSPVMIAAACFVLAIRWLSPGPVVSEVLSAVLGIVVLGYCLFLGHKESRRWDEVQRASQGFASANGWVWGGFATLVLLMVPPVMDWLVDLVNAVVNARGTRTPDITNHLAVRMAFAFGIVLVMAMQTLAITVFTVIWNRRMGGIREQS